MHVYTQTPSSDTLQHALGELKSGVEGNTELSEHVDTVALALEEAIESRRLANVVWQGDTSRGLYRVVQLTGREAGSFLAERGHVDATGDLSWNSCGSTVPVPVFREILRSYCQVQRHLGEQRASVRLDHASSKITRQHAGAGKPEGTEGGDS